MCPRKGSNKQYERVPTSNMKGSQQAVWNWLELEHDKTNKMICATGEDSDQPWHLPGLIKIFAVHTVTLWIAKDPNHLQVDSEDSDQTAQLHKLIWVFIEHTGHFLGLFYSSSFIELLS